MTTPPTGSPACAPFPTAWWYPQRRTGQDNHGDLAKTICAICPQRVQCLDGALQRGEEWGVWAGAGESRRRVLRRASADGRLDAVVAAHWRQLDGVAQAGDQGLLAVPGKGATHGRRATQAKGCDCRPCKMSASFDGVVKTLERPRVPRRAVAA